MLYAVLRLNLAEALERDGVKETNLKVGIFGAEPWTESMRERIEDMLHIDALNVYGLSEVMGPGVSMECMCKQGMHIWEDHFLPEIIGPDNKGLPYGQQGDLTFTTLSKHGMPLLRYRTHDLCTLTTNPAIAGVHMCGWAHYGSYGRYADYPRCERVPVADRARAAAGGRDCAAVSDRG